MKIITLTINRQNANIPTTFQRFVKYITNGYAPVVQYSLKDQFIITDERGENQELDTSNYNVNYTIKTCKDTRIGNINVSPIESITTSVIKNLVFRPKQFGDDNFYLFKSEQSFLDIEYLEKEVPIILESVYNTLMYSQCTDVYSRIHILCISEDPNTSQYLIAYDTDIFGTEINNFIIWYFTECMKDCYHY